MSAEYPEQRDFSPVDQIIEKYFKVDDSGVSESVRERVARAGRPLPRERDEDSADEPKGDWKYEQFVGGGEARTNNLWNLFRPTQIEQLNHLFKKLRDIHETDKEDEEYLIEEQLALHATGWAMKLYYLLRSGNLKRAMAILGPSDAEALMEINVLVEAGITSEPADPEKGRQREEILRRLYVIFHDLGLDAAALDG